MNEQTIRAVVEEMSPLLTGLPIGKIFQLSRVALAIDFRIDGNHYLFINVEPGQPRLYFIKRTVRELERQSLAPSSLVLALRKQLGGALLQAITKDEQDRIVRLSFSALDAAGGAHRRFLLAQLTGRSSNLYLLDHNERIIDTLRPLRAVAGQEIGDVYQPPSPLPASHARNDAPALAGSASTPPLSRGAFASLSEAADDYYTRLAAARIFDQRTAAHAARLRQQIAKQRKLLRNLESDTASHGDAKEHKRVGDLLLANIATAERRGRIVRLTDYYRDDASIVEIEVDENRSLQEVAAERFARYAKAKRAAQEIVQRIATANQELTALEARRIRLEEIIAGRDGDALDDFGGGKERVGRTARDAAQSQRKRTEIVPGARRYRSSDGHEIFVGRAARDNDHLTFRVARAHDLWLHAADYPGSHVIVRNQQRGAEQPHRTIIEAAQLAAYFSHARKDSKVAVNYTQRKFLSKPKGASPGLVRMSSFRTIVTEPRESVERVKDE